MGKAEIDNHIAEIEFHIHTATLPLWEEKEFLSEIQELKRNRRKVSQVSGIEDNIKKHNECVVPIKEKLDKIRAELGKAHERKKKAQEKLMELQEHRREQLGDLSQLVQFLEKHNKVRAKIQEKIKERNQIRDDYRAKEKEYNDYLYILRQMKKERQSKEQQIQEAFMA